MKIDPPKAVTREERLQGVLAVFFQEAENGGAPDRLALMDRHVDLADDLAEFFDVHDRIVGLVSPTLGPVREPSESESKFAPGDGREVRESATKGDWIVGDYEPLEEIARGGMGIVYRARQRSLNRLVALKVIREGARATAEDAQRFRNEAQSIAELDHPNIVPVHEIGDHRGATFFSMKLIEGGSLAERLTEYTVDARAAALVMAAVARAVHHAHQRGILHRDLKPSNILIDECGQPLVVDFGLARRVDCDSDLTQTGAILGTPSYMAPEQATGRRGAVTTATDVHGLGAILYALLTGGPPFRGASPLEILDRVREHAPEPPSAIRTATDRDLETICLKCMEKDPGLRYGSAEKVAEDLDRWLANKPISARPARRIERAWRWCRRNPRTAIMNAAMTVLLMVSAVAIVSRTKAHLEAARLKSQVRGNERALRGQQVARDVKDAARLWAENRSSQALQLLERCRPAPGEADLRSFAWHYFHRLCSVGQAPLRGHDGDVYFAVYSPDGKTLATAGKDKTVRLWDVDTGETRSILSGHSDEVNAVAFSPDGQMIGTASDDLSVKFWDAGGKLKTTRWGHQDRVVAVNFTPDGQSVFSCSRDGTLCEWDSKSFTQMRLSTITGNGTIQGLAISPDSQTLALAGARLVVCSVSDHHELARLGDDSDQRNGVVFSHDGKNLVAAHKNGTVQVWDALTWRLKSTLEASRAQIESAAFVPDDRTLASVDDHGFIQLWDRVSNEREMIASGQGRLWSVAFAPDGGGLATTSSDGTVRLWNLGRDRPRIHLTVPSSSNPVFAFTPDGRTLIAADDLGNVWSFDPANGHLRTAKRFAAGSPTVGASLSNDAGLLATVEERGSLTLWELPTGRQIGSFRVHVPVPSHLAISPGGAWVAALRKPGEVCVWSIPGGQSERYLGVHGSRLIFAPRGDEFMGTGWGNQSPALWSLASGRSRSGRGSGHKESFNAAAFSRDGTVVATGGGDGSVILWDVRSLEQRFVLHGFACAISALGFSADGRTLVSAGEDRIVRLWDLATRTDLATLEGHSGYVKQIRFAPHGMTLVTLAEARDGQCELFLWPAAPQD